MFFPTVNWQYFCSKDVHIHVHWDHWEINGYWLSVKKCYSETWKWDRYKKNCFKNSTKEVKKIKMLLSGKKIVCLISWMKEKLFDDWFQKNSISEFIQRYWLETCSFNELIKRLKRTSVCPMNSYRAEWRKHYLFTNLVKRLMTGTLFCEFITRFDAEI